MNKTIDRQLQARLELWEIRLRHYQFKARQEPHNKAWAAYALSLAQSLSELKTIINRNTHAVVKAGQQHH